MAAVIDLLRRVEVADHERVTAAWSEIVPFVFRSPGFRPEEDALTIERDGVPVAFTGVLREDPEGLEPFMSWIVVDPSHRAPVLPYLLDWDMAHAERRGAAVLRHLAYRNDEVHRGLLVERGFRRVRSTWTMHRTLDGIAPMPDPPDGIRIATLSEHLDEHGLFEAEQEAFSEHFGFAPETFEEWRYRRFDDAQGEHDRWLVALEGERIVAFLLEAIGGDVAQVAVLGTRRDWRGRGIATALLRTSFARMADSGHREVTLWVDSENETGAVGLYESVGMRPIVIDDTYELDLSDRT